MQQQHQPPRRRRNSHFSNDCVVSSATTTASATSATTALSLQRRRRSFGRSHLTRSTIPLSDNRAKMQRQCQRLRFVFSNSRHLLLSEASPTIEAAANTGVCLQSLRHQQHSAAHLRINVCIKSSAFPHLLHQQRTIAARTAALHATTTGTC
jgi:hypothetical protein